MKTIKILVLLTILSLTQTALAQIQASVDKKLNTTDATILFQEDFEDTDFASRGWYDALRGALTTSEHVEGSSACLECIFRLGERGCEGGTPGRHLFEGTDEIYLSYYVKYSANYTGSNKPYHPHEFHFITNENSAYVGPAYTHLTLYIEHNEQEPLLAIQDGENIIEANIGVDLTDLTEERAVAGCNGDSDGYGEGDCYLSGAIHYNGKQWRTGNVYFQDEPGKYYKNEWHFIEAYFKLNSIVEGKGIPDGIVRYWYDGEILIDHENVMLRTGQYSDMKFNQFLMAPYIGPGSPVEQVMWVDNLTVASSRINYANRTPKIVALWDQTVNEGEELSFEISLIDHDGDIITFSAELLPEGAAFDVSTGEFQWTPGYDQSGAYEVSFTATDNGEPNLTNSGTITITVVNINQAPKFKTISDHTIDIGDTLTITLQAVDPDDDAITFSVSGLPQGAAFDASTGVFIWTPSESQEGTHNIVFIATDDGEPPLSGSQEVEIIVKAPSAVFQQFSGNACLELEQNYPNPFSQFTTIKYQLTISDNVVLKIYDMFGSEVRTLVDEFQDAGEHSAVFEVGNLLCGIYYYTIQIGGRTESGKMALVR